MQHSQNGCGTVAESVGYAAEGKGDVQNDGDSSHGDSQHSPFGHFLTNDRTYRVKALDGHFGTKSGRHCRHNRVLGGFIHLFGADDEAISANSLNLYVFHAGILIALHHLFSGRNSAIGELDFQNRTTGEINGQRQTPDTEGDDAGDDHQQRDRKIQITMFDNIHGLLLLGKPARMFCGFKVIQHQVQEGTGGNNCGEEADQNTNSECYSEAHHDGSAKLAAKHVMRVYMFESRMEGQARFQPRSIA